MLLSWSRQSVCKGLAFLAVLTASRLTYSQSAYEMIDANTIKGTPRQLSPAPGEAYVFVTGMDDEVWFKHWVDGKWTAFQHINPGAKIKGSPCPALSYGVIQVFVTGLDDQVYRASLEASGKWTSFHPIQVGARIMGSPTVVSSDQRLDIFVTGLDRQVWTTSSNGSSFTPYVSIRPGSAIEGSPAATSRGPGLFDVVVRGLDNQAWITSYENGKWSAFVPVQQGAIIRGDPAVTSIGPDRLDIFVRGLDDAVWHKVIQLNEKTSTAFYKIDPGRIKGSPVANARSPDGLDVFVTGLDDRVWHKWWIGGTWLPIPPPPAVIEQPQVCAERDCGLYGPHYCAVCCPGARKHPETSCETVLGWGKAHCSCENGPATPPPQVSAPGPAKTPTYDPNQHCLCLGATTTSRQIDCGSHGTSVKETQKCWTKKVQGTGESCSTVCESQVAVCAHVHSQCGD